MPCCNSLNERCIKVGIKVVSWVYRGWMICDHGCAGFLRDLSRLHGASAVSKFRRPSECLRREPERDCAKRLYKALQSLYSFLGHCAAFSHGAADKPSVSRGF